MQDYILDGEAVQEVMALIPIEALVGRAKEFVDQLDQTDAPVIVWAALGALASIPKVSRDRH